MSELIDEIYSFVLPEMAANGIDDTLENRYIFLTGLKDAWREEPTPDDPGQASAKSMYDFAITMEILALDIRLGIFRTGKKVGILSESP